MGGPENGNYPLLYVVKCPYVGGWVVQKRLKTPLHNIKIAPIGDTFNVCIGMFHQCKKNATSQLTS